MSFWTLGTVWGGLVHLSLMHGWIPTLAKVGAVVLLLLAVGWRSRRVAVTLGVALGIGVLLALGARWYVDAQGWAGDPAPLTMWLWVGLTGVAITVAVASWALHRWWRRVAAVTAVPACALCAALTLNLWLGYVPTVASAWTEMSGGPVLDQVDGAAVAEIQRSGIVPDRGTVLSVTIDSSASGFKHRDELVYLPPQWFSTVPPPPLPTVMMIGGEFNTPTDWLRAGNAIETLDAYVATHGGRAPVFVFADSGGGFNVDTECVNGSRGNAADHLTKDIVPYVNQHFGTSPDPSRWAVEGFSAGGTCAIDLTVMHPELFGSFVDIAGDTRPNSGTTEQSINRLFGGDRAAWQAYDPATVIAKHGRYQNVSAKFVVSGGHPDAPHGLDPRNPEHAAALQLCDLGTAHGIDCEVIPIPGKHDWPCAGRAFAATLPWLSERLRA